MDITYTLNGNFGSDVSVILKVTLVLDLKKNMQKQNDHNLVQIKLILNQTKKLCLKIKNKNLVHH